MDYERSIDAGSDNESANLVPELTSAAAAANRTGGILLLPDAQNVVVLPEGASIDDIVVRGRDLIIEMPDGRIFVIPEGAVYVPQIVVEGVSVPPLNLAALLTGDEPEPAAGTVGSSGGNFADPAGSIQAAFGLGNLLPYTELAFPEPRQQEVIPGKIDNEPDVVIIDGAPASNNVIDKVSEIGLPGTRVGGAIESPGSSAGNGDDSTTGTIVITSLDGIAQVTINGVVVTGNAGQQITTDKGVLTLGALANGSIPYTYKLVDNTSGDNTTDVFSVRVTDSDGDVASATLTIEIVDDVPTARNDTDSVPAGSHAPISGNVLTGADTTSGSAGADTQGADGAQVSGLRAGTAGLSEIPCVSWRLTIMPPWR